MILIQFDVNLTELFLALRERVQDRLFIPEILFHDFSASCGSRISMAVRFPRTAQSTEFRRRSLSRNLTHFILNDKQKTFPITGRLENVSIRRAGNRTRIFQMESFRK